MEFCGMVLGTSSSNVNAYAKPMEYKHHRIWPYKAKLLAVLSVWGSGGLIAATDVLKIIILTLTNYKPAIVTRI